MSPVWNIMADRPLTDKATGADEKYWQCRLVWDFKRQTERLTSFHMKRGQPLCLLGFQLANEDRDGQENTVNDDVWQGRTGEEAGWKGTVEYVWQDTKKNGA